MKDTRVRTCSVYVASVAVCALLALALLPSLTQPARADLPPRPTPQPTPQPPHPPKLTGGFIQLLAQFPQDWPWATVHWQDPWTVVQWLDEWGYWRDVEVEGWQGTLDEFQDGVGQKTWWVAKDDLGRGPFRWRAYRGQGGRLLATSEQFYLPQRNGETVRVELSLTP